MYIHENKKINYHFFISPIPLNKKKWINGLNLADFRTWNDVFQAFKWTHLHEKILYWDSQGLSKMYNLKIFPFITSFLIFYRCCAVYIVKIWAISMQDISVQDKSVQDISVQDISVQDISEQDISVQYISVQDISVQDISVQYISI